MNLGLTVRTLLIRHNSAVHPKAQALIDRLQLVPLPEEGGWFRETYRDDRLTIIYYLITPESPSGWHRVADEEWFLWHEGDLVEQVHFDGSLSTVMIGPAEQGATPQVHVPGGVWQAARVLGDWALLSTIVSPPFEWHHFETPDDELRSRLKALAPGFR